MIAQITQSLFVGEYSDVVGQTTEETNLRFGQLKNLGISDVLSLCNLGTERCLLKKEKGSFKAHRDYAARLHHQAIPDKNGRYAEGFKLALKELNRILSNNPNAKVLVHCLGGVDRSPFLVAAYLVKYCHLSLSTAYNQIREVRPSIAAHYEWAWWTDFKL